MPSASWSQKAPDLKAIADLGKYAAVFKDQEEPSKGRFYQLPGRLDL